MQKKLQSDNDLRRRSALVLATGFILNLAWENAQALLYRYYTGFTAHFGACFVAAVVDALVTLLLYFLFALFPHTWRRLSHGEAWHILLLGMAGGMVAVWFEKWALGHGTWAYTGAMPLIPVLEVGWLPVLQLMFLPYLTFWVSDRLAPAEPGS